LCFWRYLRSSSCDLEFLSADFDRGFEHETRYREDCSPPAHTGQKNSRLTLLQDLKNQIESDPNFLSKVVTWDGIWCCGYDSETKQASSQWKTSKSPRPIKARQVRWNLKRMLIVRGFVHRELVPSGQTVNREFYLEVLSDWERMCKENPQNCGDRVIGFCIMTTPPAHTAVCDPVFGLSGMDRPSPPTLFTGPSPCDFFLFPTMEKHWKERDSPTWMLKQFRRRHSATSSFSSSRDASHSGRKDWTSVLPAMDSILKGIKCFFFEM